MLDLNKHKFFLLKVLKDIYSDPELASSLGFKGGTALMFFYGLPRFSIDLDFNLIAGASNPAIYPKIREILSNYGEIRDEAEKHYGLLLVLNYEIGGRNLKVEISNRNYADKYELKNYLGVSMNVMDLEYMFTHKLMAILDRTSLTNRDIFDSWFCMNKRLILKKSVLDQRLSCEFGEYMDRCIESVSKVKSNRILDGIGELMDNDLKNWVKKNLISEFITLAGIYKEMKLIN